MSKRHKSVQENIMKLLQTFPNLGENYNTLVSFYWVLFDGISDLNDLYRATPAETITRNFRHLVNIGKIEVPERIKKMRKEKEVEFKSEFSALV